MCSLLYLVSLGGLGGSGSVLCGPDLLLSLALPGPSLLSLAGDVHIAITDRSGQLEVEVIEARGLTPKPGSKSLPGGTKYMGGSALETGGVHS